MSDVAASPEATVSLDTGPLTVRQAADLAYQRRTQSEQTEAPKEAAEPVQELSQVDNAAPPQEATGETQDSDPAELPLIERPRSWSKEKDAIWSSLPRETQEYLSEHDRESSKAIRRAQNEAAEKAKTVEAERSQLEQHRKQYESALPILLQTLQATQAGEYSDIRTIQDVEKMAREDWPRYVMWDAQQKKIAAVQQEILASQQRQVSERQQQFSTFAKEQDKLFLEAVPEFADSEKAAKLQKQTVEYLKDVGFTDDELVKGWSEREAVSLRDARMQRVLLDASRYREAKEAARKVAAKPLPPPQRSGAPKAPAADKAANIASLEQQLKSATGNKAAQLAAQLLRARRTG